MIYLSTDGFQTLTPQTIIHRFKKQGIKCIELSGGKYVSQKVITRYLKKKNDLNFSLHNIFCTKKKFVINLASIDKEIFKKTFSHIKKY